MNFLLIPCMSKIYFCGSVCGGQPDSSVGRTFGFWLAMYLCRAGLNPTGANSKNID